MVWKLTNVSVGDEQDGDTVSHVFINGVETVMPNRGVFFMPIRKNNRRFGEDLSLGLKLITDNRWEFMVATEEGFIFRRLEKFREGHFWLPSKRGVEYHDEVSTPEFQEYFERISEGGRKEKLDNSKADSRGEEDEG